jgi:hypothetical protein
MLFLILTAAIATIGRVEQGVEQALSSRYSIISSLLITCAYISFVDLYKEKMSKAYFIWGGLVLLILYFHILSYFQYLPISIAEKLEYDRKIKLAQTGAYVNHSLGWPLPDKREPKRVLTISDSLGIYSFRESIYSTEDLTICTNCITFNGVDIFDIESKKLRIFGWAIIKGVDSDTITPYMQLKNNFGETSALFPCESQRRQEVTDFYKNDDVNYNSSGYFCACDTSELKKDSYTIQLILTNRKYKAIIETGKTFSNQ